MAVMKVNLSGEQETQVKQEIEQHLTNIQASRARLDLDKQWEDSKNLYEGLVEDKKPPPWDGAADYHIQETTMMVDIATLKSKKQTFTPKPLVLLEPEEDTAAIGGMKDTNIRDREDWLDYKLRRNCEAEKILTPLYRDAYIYGTGILKVIWEKTIEYPMVKRTFLPGQKELFYTMAMENEFSKDKIEENLLKMEAGETVEVVYEEKRTKFRGVRLGQVKIENFYVNPDIVELDRQPLISERIEQKWIDIQRKVDSGYFKESAVAALKRKYPKKYQKRDYILYENILYSDFEKKGHSRRYVITMEDETKEILRAIYFPYDCGLIYYVPYYIIPRNDSFYGYGFCSRSKDGNLIIDDLWNDALNMADMHQNPPKSVTGEVRVPADAGPGSIFYATSKDDSVSNLQLTPFTTESYTLLGLSIRMHENVIGVSAGMSGKESLSDPRAPAAKTAMLLSTANERLEDYIGEIQKGNAMLAELVEKIYLEYGSEEDLLKIKEDETEAMAVLSKKMRYVPHGLEIPLSKAFELQTITNFIDFIGQFPEVMQNPKARMIILESFIDALGGIIEKRKKEIIPNVESDPAMQALANLPPEKLAELNDKPLGEIREAIANLSQIMGQQKGGIK